MCQRAEYSEELPHELFHYTTVDVFLKILQTNTVWFSDLRYLNDRNEDDFCKSLVLKAASRLNFQLWIDKLVFGQASPTQVDTFIQGLQSFMTGRVGLHFEADPSYMSSFIFCLSRNGDSLAQWRGYGNQEVCIGFSYAFLNQTYIERGQHSRFGPVRYYDSCRDYPEITSEIESMLDSKVDSLLNGEQWSSMTLSSSSALRPFFMKHIGFASEEEWRVLVRRYASGIKAEKHYMLRSSHQVPIPTLIEPAPKITSVTFGPGTDKKLFDYFSAMIRSIFPAKPDWQVRRSSIPYRS